MGSVKIIERFHLLFVSDVRTVYENFAYFYFSGVRCFWLLNQILCDLSTNKLNKLNSNQMSTIANAKSQHPAVLEENLRY